MVSEAQKCLARMFGEFYLRKNDNNREKALEELTSLHINRLDLKDDVLYIYTSRPGLLIGRRGTNIDALAEYFKGEVKVVDDDCLLEYMLPLKGDDAC